MVNRSGDAGVMTVAGWPAVFRGSDAVAAGLITWGVLRGAGYRRLLPDTYASVGTVLAARNRSTDGPTATRDCALVLRSHAAYRWARGRAVVSGYSAAELLDRSCAPLDAPAELTVAEHILRCRDGVLVRRGPLHPGEITAVEGIRVTTPLRTAFDLGCRLDLVEAVVAVDALARGRFRPDLLLNFAVRYPGTRGVRHLAEVLSYADARSGSPPETRLRMLLVLAGLPRPAVQHPVLDDDARRAVWLDLAYPAHRIGIEYEGADHARPERVLRDTSRYTRLVAAGWRIYRYTHADLGGDPERIIADIGAALDEPAWSDHGPRSH